MGRRKLEMKRIEDKNSRQVTFSKRRAGLIKKARHLSVLCDVAVAVAVVVFSSRGKLYEYCSRHTDSVGLILSRYQKSCLQTEETTSTIQEGGASTDVGLNKPCTRFRTCNELLQSVRRVDEEGNEASVSEMTELEEELSVVALMQIRSRKTQLLMERVSTFHEQDRKLTEEKDELKRQVALAKQQKDDIDDGNGGLEGFATNLRYQLNPAQPLLTTLALFKD